MRYARCKCGHMEFWGSGMEPARCAKCEKCGSGYGYSPTSHRDPVPHDMTSVEHVKTDQGDMTITRCRYCYKTQQEIDKEEKTNAS